MGTTWYVYDMNEKILYNVDKRRYNGEDMFAFITTALSGQYISVSEHDLLQVNDIVAFTYKSDEAKINIRVNKNDIKQVDCHENPVWSHYVDWFEAKKERDRIYSIAEIDVPDDLAREVGLK